MSRIRRGRQAPDIAHADAPAPGAADRTARDRPRAGLVHVLYGSEDGLTTNNMDIWTQDVPGIKGQTEAGDEFRAALAVADFDGRDDLSIGVPLEGVAGVPEAGAVNVLYDSSGGLSDREQLFTRKTSGIKAQAGRGFRMGAALDAGDLSLNGPAKLATGIPGGTIGGDANAGAA